MQDAYFLSSLFLKNALNLCSSSLYYAIAVLSVCRLTVTLLRPTQPVAIFGNFSSPSSTLALDIHHRENFTEMVPGEPHRWGI